MFALALELIPVLNVVFIFTNAVAAALWAADLEDQELLNMNGNNVNNQTPYDYQTMETTTAEQSSTTAPVLV